MEAQGRFFTVPLQPQVAGDGALHWVKPLAEEVKVSVDAAVFEDLRGIGVGLVARDSQDLLIQAKTLFVAEVFAPVFEEAMAVKEALSWCKQFVGNKITVETDCLALVQAIRSSVPVRSQFGAIVQSVVTS